MKVRGNLNRSTLHIPLVVLILLLITGVTASVSFARTPAEPSAGARIGRTHGSAPTGLNTGEASLNTLISPTPTATSTVCVPGGGQTFTNPSSITIPESGPAVPYPAPIVVAGGPASITDVNVTLNGLSHTYPDDIDMLLVGPLGQKVMLMSDAGGGGDQVAATITLDDEAAGPLPDGAQINSGSYQPTDYEATDVLPAPAPGRPYANALSVFDGTNANGTWNLYVADDLAVDSGAIASGWSTTFNSTGGGNCPTSTVAVTATATATVCAVNSIVGSLTSSDPVQMGRLSRSQPTGCTLNPCPGMMDTLPRHYDAYQFMNNSTSTQCINVTLNTVGCGAGNSPSGGGFADSAGYLRLLTAGLDSFSPLDLCAGYLGDIGITLAFTSTYSFLVGSLEPFTIIVNAENPNQGCASYTLDVEGCGIALVTCAISFSDVPSGSTFYTFIRCLACRGIISGYSDGTFRPNSEVTRGQLAKIVSNAAGFSDDPGTQIFEDVPSSNSFYQWINRLTRRGIMSGYLCGGLGEPCVPPTDRPYFRWGANATRGQSSKIVSNAANFNEPVSGQSFEDVPPSHSFYEWIQRLASRNIMSGYSCGGSGEPCVPPQNRHYFRPFNNVTRGQSAKIVANTFFPNCIP